MDFIRTPKIIIRNFENSDVDKILSKGENQCESLYDAIDDLKNSFNDDFETEGRKYFAIEINNEFTGFISTTLEKPYVYFTIDLFHTYYNRANILLIVFEFIKYVHKIFPHRQIVTTSPKFKFVYRGVIENLGFIRSNYDNINDLYKYTLYSPNFNK